MSVVIRSQTSFILLPLGEKYTVICSGYGFLITEGILVCPAHLAIIPTYNDTETMFIKPGTTEDSTFTVADKIFAEVNSEIIPCEILSSALIEDIVLLKCKGDFIKKKITTSCPLKLLRGTNRDIKETKKPKIVEPKDNLECEIYLNNSSKIPARIIKYEYPLFHITIPKYTSTLLENVTGAKVCLVNSDTILGMLLSVEEDIKVICYSYIEKLSIHLRDPSRLKDLNGIKILNRGFIGLSLAPYSSFYHLILSNSPTKLEGNVVKISMNTEICIGDLILNMNKNLIDTIPGQIVRISLLSDKDNYQSTIYKDIKLIEAPTSLLLSKQFLTTPIIFIREDTNDIEKYSWKTFILSKLPNENAFPCSFLYFDLL